MKGGPVVQISDARDPAESRPGHPAIFSGLLEDPSALLSLWETYRTLFDSAFHSAPHPPQPPHRRPRRPTDVRSGYLQTINHNFTILHTFRTVRFPLLLITFFPGFRLRAVSRSHPKSKLLQEERLEDLELFLRNRFFAALKANSLRPEDKTLLCLHSVGIDKGGHGHLLHTE